MLALHSHSQDVTGRVHASWRSVLMFGKWTESQSLIAADVAGLLSAGIFSYHNFQRVILMLLAQVMAIFHGTIQGQW